MRPLIGCVPRTARLAALMPLSIDRWGDQDEGSALPVMPSQGALLPQHRADGLLQLSEGDTPGGAGVRPGRPTAAAQGGVPFPPLPPLVRARLSNSLLLILAHRLCSNSTS